MSKEDFDSFLNSHEAKAKESKIDWNQQRDEWLEFISQFYSSVETWFKPYVDSGKVTYKYMDANLTEENIGTYSVKCMKVDFAGQSILLSPVGTLLIGTKGRIDMEGAKGKVQFILADKNSKGMKVNISINKKQEESEPKTIEWVWKIVLRGSRSIKFDELNERSFFDALMEIIYV